ncbi:hypothetical protein COX86_01370 [Candidatus Micrarchaeota archaeon CG_4_10_14_0_2_um_filter_60_11]|nr:MAG: hypothetical protein COU39_01605 [Candidatus Micrarchaeota archaeon CG10_big_fil_rev_8_21_14_0_10_60_32]PIO01732.1 MAG: hypothetical protein COT58_03620 [Candidatus Micrarchaeota archaeon CG09_land_8_20_14_0_10_60_16]PIY91870.1 MAG: hypothetical protein COY71_00860 [Candidatus Micrarchaeota archaeon CG_4_10_14_0_8_um_filter_60_7]PIZ91112.1 MAG: hypothetical protein COX86_01370 [Candidatus Micrarchaeota archaeon CG_4_10_14_0_2_um_filter_60_11]
MKRLLFIAACLLAVGLGYQAAPSPHSQAVFQAVAVTEDGSGMLTPFTVTATRGSGRILLDVSESRYGPDTEASLAEARDAAQTLVGSLATTDLRIDFEGAAAQRVSGESGGAAFAIAMVSAVSGAQLRPEGAVSAQLNGTRLAPVGGIDEKILAAEKAGKKFFVVARGQEIKYEQDLNKRIAIVRVDTLAQAASILLLK